MKRLRVAHVIQHFAEGELETTVAKLAMNSREHGVDSIVIGYLGDGPLRARLEASGVRTHLLPRVEGTSTRLPGRLAAVLAQADVHAVHTHEAGSFMYGAAAASMLGIPSVHTEHGEQLFATVRVRGTGAAPSRLSVAGGADTLLNGAGDVAARTLLIANGIALRTRPTRFERANARAELGLGEEAFVFGSVARWSTKREAAELVEAFASMAQEYPAARLVLACDGSSRKLLSARVTSLGIDERVRLLGQPDDIAAWLPALDAFALTSMHARAVLEAMAAFVPVIATAVGGLPSLLRNRAGAVLANGDVAGVAQLMATFITSPWLCDDYATLGRARVEAEHSERAMTTAYSVLYRAACSPRQVTAAQVVRCVATN